MSREYGWTAVGVYLSLSALDFPFCFLAVRWLGTDTIGHYEHVVVEGVKGLLKWPIQGSKMAELVADEAVDEAAGGKEVEQLEQGQRRVLEEKSSEEVINDHGYREAMKANRGDNASMISPSTHESSAG
jgi:N-terminal acetyltransferase 2